MFVYFPALYRYPMTLLFLILVLANHLAAGVDVYKRRSSAPSRWGSASFVILPSAYKIP
jgi:hypothetical protein